MLSVELKDDRSENVHYDHSDYPIYIRKALLSYYNNFEAPSHWHDDIEFIVVLQGEMNYNINGEVIAIRQGEGVFVNSRQLHYGFSESRTECEFICILLHPMLLCVTQSLEQKFIVPLLNSQNLPYLKLSAETACQKEMLGCIMDIYGARNDETAPIKIISLFLKIWSLVYENSEIATMPKVRNDDLTIIKNMVGYIQKYYCEKITLDDIAAAGAVGQSKCCKLFDRYIGFTPNAYLIKYRLNQSTWYLKNTDMTITEIAQAVGFSGSSYYAEAFRKWYRVSPTGYRKWAV